MKFKVKKEELGNKLKKHLGSDTTFTVIYNIPEYIELEGELVEDGLPVGKDYYMSDIAIGKDDHVELHYNKLGGCLKRKIINGVDTDVGVCQGCDWCKNYQPQELMDNGKNKGGHTCTNGNCDCLSKQNPPQPIEEISFEGLSVVGGQRDGRMRDKLNEVIRFLNK